uniref:Uncharacterized protein n=1 Tax=Anopheles minimus TaxID=112268 RepID=A0A182WN07_9DIPT
MDAAKNRSYTSGYKPQQITSEQQRCIKSSPLYAQSYGLLIERSSRSLLNSSQPSIELINQNTSSYYTDTCNM